MRLSAQCVCEKGKADFMKTMNAQNQPGTDDSVEVPDLTISVSAAGGMSGSNQVVTKGASGNFAMPPSQPIQTPASSAPALPSSDPARSKAPPTPPYYSVESDDDPFGLGQDGPGQS